MFGKRKVGKVGKQKVVHSERRSRRQREREKKSVYTISKQKC